MDSLRNLARRLADLAGTFFHAFVRENRVLPPVAALLALFLFAWVVAGAFIDESGEDGTSGEADLVQSREPSGDTPVAPQAEDRDVDSYAAYRNKDPFRQLLAPAETTSEETPEQTSEQTTEETLQEDTAVQTPPGGTTASVPPGGPNAGGGTDAGTGSGQRSRADSDGDGLRNRQEERLGQDPRDPDTDDDGTEDGADDSDNDGVPDGQRSNAGGPGGDAGAGGAGAGAGGAGGGRAGGGAGGGGANGPDEELFDSGGGIYPP